jgi:putative ABC transport system permease protein
MNLLDLFRGALWSLGVNKLRTGLTMLGVIIGVAAVISMVSIIEGGKQKIVESIERLGTNLLFVSPTVLTEEELRQFAGRSKGLRYVDADAVAQIPAVGGLAPMVSVSAVVKSGGQDFEGSVFGTVPSYQEVRNFHAETGRFLLPEDVERSVRVVVIGRDVAAKLFPEAPVGAAMLGRDVKIGEDRFVVVGIMEKKGSLHGQNYDEMMFMPVTTAMRYYKGDDRISHLLVHVDDRGRMTEAMNGIRETLKARHQGVEDFKIHSQEDFLKAVDRTIMTFSLMLGGIAAVSLLVGGIGIMNIMLVTVTERTREIGLRKAIGASRADILTQFLTEAVAISLLGGLIGIGLGMLMGVGFGRAVARAMPGGADWGAIITPGSVVWAFLFSAAVGVFFGWYPAYRASKLDPAVALRYE